MINLLPPATKKSYAYARRNVVLRRWVTAFVLAFVGLGIIATFGLLTIHQSTKTYNDRIAASEELLKKEKFTETQAQVKDITSSFKLVVQVLGQEVLFSQLLKQIAATMPNGANLTALNISQTKGALDITAIATDYKTATQVQVNLGDPANKIFSKADIISTTCNGTVAIDPKYPCTITIRALFATNNPFLFVNSKQTSP
jgi:Tfp pilus assembly protein PilN